MTRGLMSLIQEASISFPRWVLRFAIRWDLPPAAAGLLLYLRSLAPGVYGFDSAELITGAFTLGIVHPTGYPVYLMLAKAFTGLPFGSIAYRVNLLSAVMAAITVWLVARFGYAMTRCRWASWLGAAALAVAFTFWSMAVVAEVYTLHTAFLMLNLLLLERWASERRDGWLIASGLVMGLSLANHASSLLFVPAVFWLILRQPDLRSEARGLLLGALAGVVGLATYLYLPLRFAANPPLNYVRDYYQVDLRTLEGLWWMVSGQAYRFFAFGYDAAGYLQELGAFFTLLWRNFTGLGLAFGAVGLVSAIARRMRWAFPTLLAFGATVLFFAGYAVADKATMYLPALVIWAAWIVLGLNETYGALRRWNLPFGIHPRWTPRAIQVAACFAVVASGAANFRWLDMSDAHGPDLYARQILDHVAPGALVMGPWSSAVVLEYYQQVEGMRPDVQIFNRSRFEVAEYYKYWASDTPHAQAVAQILASEQAMVEAAYLERPVYDLERNPGLAASFEYQPVGRFFHLVLKEDSDQEG